MEILVYVEKRMFAKLDKVKRFCWGYSAQVDFSQFKKFLRIARFVFYSRKSVWRTKRVPIAFFGTAIFSIKNRNKWVLRGGNFGHCEMDKHFLNSYPRVFPKDY